MFSNIGSRNNFFRTHFFSGGRGVPSAQKIFVKFLFKIFVFHIQEKSGSFRIVATIVDQNLKKEWIKSRIKRTIIGREYEGRKKEKNGGTGKRDIEERKGAP